MITIPRAPYEPLWPKDADPPRLERVVLFDDHDAPPTTDAEMRRLVEQAASWGVTDVVDGVSNVVGGLPYILGSGTPQDRMKRLRDYAQAHEDAGLRYHTSLWHKPGPWHAELLRLTRALSDVLGELQASTIWDMEGHTFGPRSKMDHRQGAADAGKMSWDLACPWGMTIIPHHVDKARPYMSAASWLLLQVLSFEDPERGMGLANPHTMPGLWVEDILDALAGKWSWIEETTQTVILNASYKLDQWRRVDPEDAFMVPLLVLSGRGRKSGGVFSRLWMERSPLFGAELARIGRLRDVDAPTRTEELLGGETPESSENALWGVDVARDFRRDGDRAKVLFEGAEGARVYDDVRATVEAVYGFTWDDRAGAMNLVLVETPGGVDAYDDDLLICWVDDAGAKRVERYPANLEPSSRSLRHPVPMARRRGGTAKIKVPQQVEGYVIGEFRGALSLLALPRHTDPTTVLRDGDRDGVHEAEIATEDTGHFGIYGHQGGAKGTGSAGCWTWPRQCQRAVARRLRQHRQRHGNLATATFIDRHTLEL